MGKGRAFNRKPGGVRFANVLLKLALGAALALHGHAASGEAAPGGMLAGAAEALRDALRAEGWSYATNPKEEARETNCVIFLVDLLEQFYPLEPRVKRRVLVNDPLARGEELEALVLAHDSRIRGVQSALAELAAIGVAVPHAAAARGDLIQYWYWSAATGALAGHSGVIGDVVRNTDDLFEFELVGAHKSINGPGNITVTLTGRNLNHAYLVRIARRP